MFYVYYELFIIIFFVCYHVKYTHSQYEFEDCSRSPGPSGVGGSSRYISFRFSLKTGQVVVRYIKVSGASSQSLHSGATGFPILFWCFERKLCPVRASVRSWG